MPCTYCRVALDTEGECSGAITRESPVITGLSFQRSPIDRARSTKPPLPHRRSRSTKSPAPLHANAPNTQHTQRLQELRSSTVAPPSAQRCPPRIEANHRPERAHRAPLRRSARRRIRACPRTTPALTRSRPIRRLGATGGRGAAERGRPTPGSEIGTNAHRTSRRVVRR